MLSDAGSVLVVADRVRTAAGILGDAVLVRSGTVQAVGWADALRRPGLAEERYRGAVLVPGLGDAHFHPMGYGAALSRLNLGGAADLDEVFVRLRSSAGSTSPGQPLIGTRLDDEALAEKRLPLRHEIDSVAADRPVLLYRYCGHVAVANTAAFEAAGIGPSVVDPVGGHFGRDDSGGLTGLLQETAVSLVGDVLGGRVGGLKPAEVLAALHRLVALGMTRICAIVATGSELFCGVGNELDLLIDIASDLPLHVSALVVARDPDDLEQAARRMERAGRRLQFLGMKDFTDGSLGGRTAALGLPYSDDPTTTGTLRFDHERLYPLARRSLQLGGSVALHAIGDVAVGRVLDLYGILAETGVDPDRLRIEHASVTTDADIARMADLGVTASVQPAFLASEGGWLRSRLGDRVEQTYRFRTMESAGVPMAGGSDCPVEPPSPLWGMAAARHRGGLVPSESLEPDSALALFTDGVATAVREPSPLSAGSRADFTLLDIDPVDVDPVTLRNASVIGVWIDGEPQDLDLEAPSWV
ncbi:MAG: amidohydrolase [Acidimicrobiia bacterium]|nr:amidohydrolase [Acidimicrobiia bacterium]